MKERPIIFSAPMVQALLAGRKTQTRRAVKPQPKLNFSVASLAFAADGGIPECPYGKLGDRLWVKEKYTAHWGGEPMGDGARLSHRQIVGAQVRQSNGSYVTSTEADPIRVWYAASGDKPYPHSRWHSPIHCPRWASRITLEIEDVRVQRVQDISEADAKSEGVDGEAALICSEGCRHRDREGDHLEEWEEDGDWGRICPECGERLWNHPLDECNRQAFRDLWESINGTGSWEANPWVWVLTFKRAKGGAA